MKFDTEWKWPGMRSIGGLLKTVIRPFRFHDNRELISGISECLVGVVKQTCHREVPRLVMIGTTK